MSVLTPSSSRLPVTLIAVCVVAHDAAPRCVAAIRREGNGRGGEEVKGCAAMAPTPAADHEAVHPSRREQAAATAL